MNDMMKRLGFTPDEAEFFINLSDKLSSASREAIDALKPEYLCESLVSTDPLEHDVSSDKAEQELEKIAEAEGIDPKSLKMLFLLECALTLPERYEKAGYDTELAYDLLCDITYKLRECEHVHNVMGTMTFDWFHNHFLLRRFALGRFQYDPTVWISDRIYDFGDIHLRKGSPIVRFHIPSSGHFPREERLDSYKRAYNFFCKEGELLILVCGSWLLYDKNREVFPQGSNLLDFMDDFDMFSIREGHSPFSQAWRVFGMDYDGDTSKLPRETTLQRNYIKWLDEGNTVGSGAGVILFDGKKIINNKRDN